MKTLRLNNQSVETISLTDNKFQVWKGKAILQVINEEYFFISKSESFKWATNFDSFKNALYHANIYIKASNITGAIKIFSGNLLFAKYENTQWVIFDEPVKQLL